MDLITTIMPSADFRGSRNLRPAARQGIGYRTGFTLVELLVVILVLVILAPLSMVVARNAIATADHAKCLGNVKQLVAYEEYNKVCGWGGHHLRLSRLGCSRLDRWWIFLFAGHGGLRGEVHPGSE
jgi:prepilin-type N-terminal cleavage/methylation domain-containing protein